MLVIFLERGKKIVRKNNEGEKNTGIDTQRT